MNHERWRQIDDIFRSVADLPIAEQSAALDVKCGQDQELRAEVEALLAHDVDGLTMLDQSGGIMLRGDTPLAVSPGDRIGPWRLGEVVGEGGGGVVFEAERDDERYERRVAIKFLNQALLTQRAIERFKTECRILGNLEHPHVAQLYDAGTTDNGIPYIVLEWVEGVRLDAWRSQQQPTLDQRLAMFSEICEAVAFAHRNLVVHRDLKPANILVTARGEPKLLDFGIARVLPGDEPEEQRLTRTFQQPMTPQYASPEQLRGDDVTTASDVYSLGLVLYELLTGTLPYKLSVGVGEEAKRWAQGTGTIPPPSAAVANALDDAVPTRALQGDLDTITLKALETEPHRRYGSTRAMAEDLDRFRNGLPILARAPSLPYTLHRFVGRNRLAVAAAATLLLLLVGFSISMTLAARRLKIEKARTEAETRTAREVVRFLGGLFEGAEPDVHQGQELTARQLLDRGAAVWNSSENQPQATRAALATAIGKAYLELSAQPEARRLLEPALAVRKTLADPSGLAESHRLMARLEWSDSDYPAAASHAEAAANLLRPLPERLDLAESLMLLGRSQGSLGDLDAAETALDEALSQLGPRSEDHPTLAGIVIRELASMDLYRGNIDRAEERIRRSLELLTLAHGPLHPEIFEARRLLAAKVGMSKEATDNQQGLPILERLLKDQRAFFGQPHEQIVWTLTDLGSGNISAYQFSAAEEFFRQAKAMQELLFDEQHFVLAVIESGLGHALWRQGKRQESVEFHRRAWEISRLNVEPESYDLAFPTLYLAEALAGTEQCKEALPLLQEGVEILESLRDQPNYQMHSSRWYIAFCQWQLGDRETSVERMRSIFGSVVEAGYEERIDHRVEIAEWRELLAQIDIEGPL